MKKILFAIATVALVFATSCKKENVNAPETLEDSEFYCVIDQNANPQNAPAIEDGMGTMATIDGQNQIFWQTTDEISYYGCKKNEQGGYDAATYHTLKCKSLSANGAYFEDEGGAHFSGQGDHKAYYPASLVVNNVPTLPATIAYDATKSASFLPMYGTGNGSHYLTFYNICAVLKVKVVCNCDKIEVSANTDICGAFTVNANNAAVLNTPTGTTNTKIALTGSFEADDYVYVAIPAGTYNGFTVQFWAINAQAAGGYESLGSKTNTSAMTVRANKIYPVTVTPENAPSEEVFHFTNTSTTESVNIVLSHYTVNNQHPAFFYYKSGFYGYKQYTFSNTKVDGEYQGDAITLAPGEKLYFKQNGADPVSAGTSTYYTYFKMTGNGTISVSGKLAYIINGTNPENATLGEYACVEMFANCTNITDASGLILPDHTAKHCYNSMFKNCSNMTAAPTLPANLLAIQCYYYMFRNCSSLSTVTMLATGYTSDVKSSQRGGCLSVWLNGAGTANPTVIVSNNLDITESNGIYHYMTTSGQNSYTPEKWTIQREDNTVLRQGSPN